MACVFLGALAGGAASAEEHGDTQSKKNKSKLHLGIQGGVHYGLTNTQSGWGPSGALSLSFFQPYLLGIHLIGEYLYINQTGSSGGSLTTHMVLPSALIGFNFNWFQHRSSLSVGGFYGFPFLQASSGAVMRYPTAGFPGVVLQGKDMWEVGSHYVFLVSRTYIGQLPGTQVGPLIYMSPLMMALTVSLGFDI